MNEKKDSVENYKSFIDKQFSFDVQKSYFGNHITKLSSPNSSQRSSQQNISGNSPLARLQNSGQGQPQTNQALHSQKQVCQQKVDLANIKKQFNNKNYEQVLEAIENYFRMYDSKSMQQNTVQQNGIQLYGISQNTIQQNGQQQHGFQQSGTQQNGIQMNGVYQNQHHHQIHNDRQIESDEKMDIEDKNKEQENEIIILMQTKSDCLLHLNRNEEFFRCQDEIFARDNSQTKVFISKGSIHFQNKRYKESLGDFQTYVSLVKNDDNAYYLKGLVEEKLKLHHEALQSFDQSLAINPTQIKVIQKKTLILATLFKYEEAVENQKKVIQYFEQNRNKQNSKQMYQQYFMMGKLYFHMNRIQDSYAFLEKAIAERFDHSETYYYLGECFRCMNQLENAIECYEKAALYDSNNTLALQRREEVQKRIQQECPNKNQQQVSSQIIEEEEIITLDDIKKDIEKLETDKKAQIQQIKEGKLLDCDLFELESTRTLVQQYSLNLAAFKSFLRVQDNFDRASVQSNKMMSSVHNFKGRTFQSALLTKEEESENNSLSLDKPKTYRNKSLFTSAYNFRAPNPPNQTNQ